MKFIITENKLDGVIYSYLTKQFENLEQFKERNLSIWTDSNKKPIIIIVYIDEDVTEIYISEEVLIMVFKMFSFNGFKELFTYLKTWFDVYAGIYSDDFFGIDKDLNYEDAVELFT
jgi:hypothetical protein